MKGNIIGFDPETNTGAISGHDGNRYDFVTLDWRGSVRPHAGDLVDFQAIDRRATDIYLVEPAYVAPGYGAFYFSPSGRISRSQYWLRFVLPYCAIFIPLQLIVAFLDKESTAYTATNGLMSLLYLVVFWPSLAILIKRMHDRNKSGWYVLFLVVSAMAFTTLLVIWIGAAFYQYGEHEKISFDGTLGVLGIATIITGAITLGINIWFFVEFGFLRGTIGANRFGPDPTR